MGRVLGGGLEELKEEVSKLLEGLEWEGVGCEGLPSSMPRPERRIGTMEIESAERAVVVYSAPMALVAFGPDVTVRALAVASVASMEVIWSIAALTWRESLMSLDLS